MLWVSEGPIDLSLFSLNLYSITPHTTPNTFAIVRSVEKSECPSTAIDIAGTVKPTVNLRAVLPDPSRFKY
jgi:hypothetical protein